MRLAFCKMEGTGNDFVFIDDRDGAHRGREAELARQLCPRRSSVGADGVIFVRRPQDGSGCAAEMAYFNADGSYSGMCGNGLRCTALFVRERWGLDATSLRLLVDAKPRLAEIQQTEPRTALVTVELGVPELEVDKVPALVPGPRHIGVPLELAPGFAPECTLLSMGNPHCVMWTQDLPAEAVHALGPVVENHPLFPERVNAGFARMEAGQVVLRVWERGSGETLACGSGAAAAAVSAILTGRAVPQQPVIVRALGGELIVNWPGEGKSALLSGRARLVYDGTVEV